MNSHRGFFRLLTLGALFCSLGACAQSHSGRVYQPHETQRSLNVYYGTIIELREVTIAGGDSGAGTVIGGIAGGVIGSTIGSNSGRALATLGGALAGAAAGTLIERENATRPGLEFTIELDDGQMLAVIQENDGVYRVGDRVRLLASASGRWRIRQ